MKFLIATLIIVTQLGAGKAPDIIQVGEQDLQEVIDAASSHSIIMADRNREIEIIKTIIIEKPLTLIGLNARLKKGLEKTAILSVISENVRIRDFHLTGNADSVPQTGRSPLIEIRRGRFVIENGVTNNSSKDGIMIFPLAQYGDIEHGVVKNITSHGTVRDTVSISGDGGEGLFVRHMLVQNIRAYDSALRGPVEVSDGSEYITVRDVYAEGCRYGVDIQDHNEVGQVNRYIIIDGLHVKNTKMAVRTANHDFGHDGLTIRNVTATDWPDDAETPFWVRHTSNLLIENVRMQGCPSGPCVRVDNGDNITLRDITLINGEHDGPGLRVADSNNVLIDNVTISGEKQPQFGVMYRVGANKSFKGLRIRNVLAPNVRDAGVVLENTSETGQLDLIQLSGNVATVQTVFPVKSK